MTILIKWTCWCETENASKDFWVEEGITPNAICPSMTDPVNAPHVIRTNSLYPNNDSKIGDVRMVEIKQNDSSVQGKYISRSHEMIAYGPQGNTTTFRYHYNNNQSISLGDFVYLEDQESDVVSICVNPKQPVGAILSPISSGVTSIPMAFANSVAQEYTKRGFYLTISNGVDISNEVEITAINTGVTPNTITFTPALTISNNATLPAYTTGVLITQYMLYKRRLGPQAAIQLGTTIIGGSAIPANINIDIIYTSNAPEPFVAKTRAAVTAGDTQMTVSRKFLRHMRVNRNYFKLTDGNTTSNEMQFLNYDDTDDTDTDLVITFTPAINVSFATANVKVQRTATKPVVFAIEGQI